MSVSTQTTAIRSDAGVELEGSRVMIVDTVNRSVLDDSFAEESRIAGVTLVGRTILTSSGDVFSPFGFDESLRDIANLYKTIDANPDRYLLVKSKQDIEEAYRTNRTGLYVYFQSPEPLATQPWRLRLFYELGLRVLQLTYNERSLLGDGCSERQDAGLTDWGVEVIRICNELGIVVDVSHCGHNTAMEAIEVSKTPVLLTHANSRTLVDNRRCKTDEEVQFCVEKGGAVGVQVLPAFVARDEPSFEKMLDHIDHYVSLVGSNHVGLGLDLTNGHEHDDYSLLGYNPDMYRGVWKDGVQQWLPGISTIGEVPNIIDKMLERGHDVDTVRKVLGTNFARVFGEIWG